MAGPRLINTDKAPTYGRALALLKQEGLCTPDVEHRQIKYRNNVIERDVKGRKICLAHWGWSRTRWYCGTRFICRKH